MNNPEAFKEDEVRSIKFIVPGLPFGKQRPIRTAYLLEILIYRMYRSEAL